MSPAAFGIPRAPEADRLAGSAHAAFRLCLLVGGLLLGACSGAHLAGLQSDFETLYSTRLEMEKGGTARGGWSDPEDIDAAMRSLSLEAREAASDVTLQAPTRIALLRLAMIAGWQGKEPDARYVVSVADTGTELCRALGEQAPSRDCALFLIVPTAALSSRYPEAYETHLRNSMVDGKIPADRKAKVVDYFQGMSAVMASALETFANTELDSYLDSHAALLDYYHEELKRYRSRLENARVFTSLVDNEPGGVADQKAIDFATCAEKWVGKVRKAKSEVKNSALKTGAKECLELLSPTG